jgi:hypothetical protein
MTADDSRIVFLVHEPTLWAHYCNVWACLPAASFAIALTRRFRPEPGRTPVAGASEFIERIDQLGYARIWAEDAVRAGIRFAWVVSNHKIGGEGLRPEALPQRLLARFKSAAKAVGRRFSGAPVRAAEWPPRPFWPMQLGRRQVRFMYGADVGDGWSLAEWNAMYDAFLCHGPNDQAQVSARFRGRAFQMGYPRYDGYFDPALDSSAERSRFAGKPGARTLLWMPTFGQGACSIPHFAAALQPLQERYNFIVRPHPLSFRQAPEDVALLRSLGYQIDDDPLRDMNRLYRIVDAMLCDYGGSAFGALYLGKRMALLEVPGSKDWYTVRNSSNLELARHYPTVTPETAGTLPTILEDDPAWSARQDELQRLSARYFADLRGTSSRRAAELLVELRDGTEPLPHGGR